eukprot:11219054-Ditylum_brightwellii.AAC.1
MAEGNGSCFGVRGRCWKAYCFPAHKLGVKNGVPPPGLPCIADYCVLLVFVVVVGGGGGGGGGGSEN